MIIGFARVSTDDQNLDAQTDALTAAGSGKLFADKISGSKRERPEMERMLDQLRDGDVVTVTKYDPWPGPSKTFSRSWRPSASAVPASGRWPRTSTLRRQPAVSLSTSLRPSRSFTPARSGKMVHYYSGDWRGFSPALTNRAIDTAAYAA